MTVVTATALERAATSIVAKIALPDRKSFLETLKSTYTTTRQWAATHRIKGFLLEDGTIVMSGDDYHSDGIQLVLNEFGISHEDIASNYDSYEALYEHYGLLRIAGFNAIDIYAKPTPQQYQTLEQAFHLVDRMYVDIKGVYYGEFFDIKRLKQAVNLHSIGRNADELTAELLVRASVVLESVE